MGVISEFKAFAVKGNVVDMAVGIIIGAAFGKIVTSLVNDIIMPPIGRLLGGIDFSSYFINLSGKPYATLVEAQKAGAATINYGIFFNNIITFLIVSFVVFILIKQINRLKKEAAAAPTEPTQKLCQFCASTIPIKASRCPHCTSQL